MKKEALTKRGYLHSLTFHPTYITSRPERASKNITRYNPPSHSCSALPSNKPLCIIS